MTHRAWWTLRSDVLLQMLYRVHGGESPELVYAEYYANSKHEYVPESDEVNKRWDSGG